MKEYTTAELAAANTHASPKNFTKSLIQSARDASLIISGELSAKAGRFTATTQINSIN